MAVERQNCVRTWEEGGELGPLVADARVRLDEAQVLVVAPRLSAGSTEGSTLNFRAGRDTLQASS